MNENRMDKEQYYNLNKSITNLSSKITKLNGTFEEMDKKVSSISNWISGDPLIASSWGMEQKMKEIAKQVDNNTKEISRVERFDSMELMLIEHEKKLNSIWTAIAVIASITTIIGVLAGIFLPGLLI